MGVRLIITFAISYTVLIIAPALLPQPLAGGAAPRVGDAVDLLTPLVLVCCYYWLFRSADDWSSEPASGPMTGLFMVGAILFIEGHGMHLSANSISHFIEDQQSSVYAITYFYDEVLSHYLWRIGTLALAVSLLWRHYQPVKKGLDLWHIDGRRWVGLGVAGFLYGLTATLAAIEGQTVALDLPAATIIAVLFALAWRQQRHAPGAPVFSFLGFGYLTATVALVVWGLYWGAFPQFSDLGIIR